MQNNNLDEVFLLGFIDRLDRHNETLIKSAQLAEILKNWRGSLGRLANLFKRAPDVKQVADAAKTVKNIKQVANAAKTVKNIKQVADAAKEVKNRLPPAPFKPGIKSIDWRVALGRLGRVADLFKRAPDVKQVADAAQQVKNVKQVARAAKRVKNRLPPTPFKTGIRSIDRFIKRHPTLSTGTAGALGGGLVGYGLGKGLSEEDEYTL